MGKLINIQRILQEDYPDADPQLVEGLASIVNNFMEQTIAEMNGNIDFTNLNREKKTITITVDSSGTPIGSAFVSTDLAVVTGMNVIRATNKTTSGTYVTSQPFITFSGTTPILKILDITGLQAANKYELVIELIGI